MMRKMGYNLQHGKSLNFGKERRGFLRNFVLKGKPTNYYDNTRRGLGYVTPAATVHSKDDKPVPSHSASSSEWESDVSVGTMFENLIVNMTSCSH